MAQNYWLRRAKADDLAEKLQDHLRQSCPGCTDLTVIGRAANRYTDKNPDPAWDEVMVYVEDGVIHAAVP